MNHLPIRKLTELQAQRVRTVLLIRRALPTLDELAAEMGVARRTLDRIAAQKTYRNVPRTVSQSALFQALQYLCDDREAATSGGR